MSAQSFIELVTNTVAVAKKLLCCILHNTNLKQTENFDMQKPSTSTPFMKLSFFHVPPFYPTEFSKDEVLLSLNVYTRTYISAPKLLI